MSGVVRILSLRLLAGESPLGYEPGLWLRREADWAAVAEQAVDRDISAVSLVSNGELIDVLKRSQWRRFEVVPQIPNITGIVRETYQHGAVGAGLRRMMMIGPANAVRVGMSGLSNVGGILRREFPAMLRVLLELEYYAFRSLKPERMVLAPQITDMAVAFEHPRLVEMFAQFSKDMGVRPYLATNNPAMLAERMGRWGTHVDGIVAPMNRNGYLCGDLSWTRSFASMDLIAETLGGGRPAEEADVEYVAAAGAKGVILDADAVY